MQRFCRLCHRRLPEPCSPGQRFCSACRPTRRVLMSYEWQAGRWLVIYRDLGVWPFPRTDRFESPGTIRDIYARFGVLHQSADREAFEFGLQTGRGMVELELTPKQYQSLRSPQD